MLHAAVMADLAVQHLWWVLHTPTHARMHRTEVRHALWNGNETEVWHCGVALAGRSHP